MATTHSWLLYTPPGLPPHCQPDTPLLALISQTLGICLPSYLALASTTAGILSIVSWLFAQMPQIWKNHRLKSVDGLSLGFLSIWLAGDVCNFLGAVWTDQMWFQQVVGAYYVFVDCILVTQYFFYTFIQPSMIESLLGESLSYDDSTLASANEEEDDSYFGDSESEPESKNTKKTATAQDEAVSPPPRHHSRSLASTLIITVSILFHLAGASPLPSTTVTISNSDFTPRDLGGLLSWLSTILYLTSRLPQLFLNFRRRSTSGLAISLFIAAFFGNLFYSVSLLLNPLGHSDYPPYGGGGIAGPDGNNCIDWWARTLPFFLGAAGVLSLDGAVAWQFVMWGERRTSTQDNASSSNIDNDQENLNDDDDDVSELEECFGNSSWWPWSSSMVVACEDEGKPLVKRDTNSRRLGYGTVASA